MRTDGRHEKSIRDLRIPWAAVNSFCDVMDSFTRVYVPRRTLCVSVLGMPFPRCRMLAGGWVDSH